MSNLAPELLKTWIPQCACAEIGRIIPPKILYAWSPGRDRQVCVTMHLEAPPACKVCGKAFTTLKGVAP
jgi:hypothetical protein